MPSVHNYVCRRFSATRSRSGLLSSCRTCATCWTPTSGLAFLTANPETNVDLMVGIGGTPEGVLAAYALKCMGGAFYGRLYPRDDERRRARDAGYDVEKVLTLDDMVRSNNVFVAATGVTDGELLRGVRYSVDRATTHSLSMRSLSGAVRLIETRHRISTSNLILRR
jgi:fructose-1,6-bisphosphatase II